MNIKVGDVFVYNCKCGSTICRYLNDTCFIYLGIKPLNKFCKEEAYELYSFKQGNKNIYPQEDLAYFKKLKANKE